MKRYSCLFVIVILISGCAPKESIFIQSMNARWTENKAGFNLFSVDKDSKLLMIDDTGGMMILTPAGEFDAANNMIQVTATIYPVLQSSDAILTATANLVCQNFWITETLCFDQQKNFPEKFKAAKEFLRNGEQGKFILFNASETPNKTMNFGLKGDDGSIVYKSSFVRRLTEEEQKKMASYPEKLAARNSLIDKTIDGVITSLNLAVAKEAVEAKAEAETDAKKTSETMASSAVTITTSGVDALPK